jgi:hypothetical protein
MSRDTIDRAGPQLVRRRDPGHGLSPWRSTTLCLTLVAFALGGCQPLMVKPSHPSTWYRDFPSHMSEELRTGVTRVAVAAGHSEVQFDIGGPDYGKQGDEVSQGMIEGMGAALSPEMGASGEGAAIYILLLPIILPIAAGVGGIAGAAEAHRRESNKEAADALIAAYEGQLPNALLAREIERQLLEFGEIEASLYRDPGAGEPANRIDADALLTVNVSQVSAWAEGSKGRLGVTVEAQLVSLPDHEPLYSDTYRFEDTRSMDAWAENDGQAWREHLRRGKLRISERIVEDLFMQVELRHVLRPLRTPSFEEFRDGKVETLTPQLSWELVMLGNDTHLDPPLIVNPGATTWELLIQRDEETVYRRLKIAQPTHTLEEPLQACGQYQWSVRPHYVIDGHHRIGEWMTVARAARDSRVEITQDFYPLLTPCR